MTKAESAIVTFDHNAQAIALKAFLELKASNKAQRATLKDKEGKAELALIMPAINYGAATFDLQPLAQLVGTKGIGLSAIAKRAIDAIFPAHAYALIGEKRVPQFVVQEGKAKVADQSKLDILRQALATFDSIHCDQIKAAFPEKDKAKGEKLEKLGKAIAARMKADGLTKADIAELLKGL